MTLLSGPTSLRSTINYPYINLDYLPKSARDFPLPHPNSTGLGSRLENLHAVIPKIHDDDPTFWGNGDPRRSVYLAEFAARLAKGTEERPIGTKHLDAVVARVANNDVTLRVYGDTLRSRELSAAGAFEAEKLRRPEVATDDDDPVVVEVRNDHVTWGGVDRLDNG